MRRPHRAPAAARARGIAAWLAALVLASAATVPAHAGALDGPAGAVRVFFEDAWYVASSPARMNRESAAWTAAIVGTGLLIYANDQEIYDAFQRSRENEWYKAALWLGDRWEPAGNMGNTNVYYVGALAVGLATRWEPLERVPAEILQSHWTAGGLRNVGEIAFGRKRPFEHEGSRAFEPGHGTSLPSGHASVMFELAAIAAHETRDTPFSIPVSTVGHFAAASVGMQRIDSGNHWPSDVYAGAVAGALISRTLLARRDARRAREAEADAAGAAEAAGPRVSFVPVLGRGAGIGGRIRVSF